MPEATRAELQETIGDLNAYRKRLRNEIISIGQKLRMPQQKIYASLAEHTELQLIDLILTELVAQRDQD